MVRPPSTALITGADAGVGAAFARRLSVARYHLVLVSDPETAYGITALEERLSDRGQPVDVLVNGAGVRADAEDSPLDVPIRSVLRLTRAALPGMVERGRGVVVNVVGAAGEAARAWVNTFTAEIADELRGTGVRTLTVPAESAEVADPERCDGLVERALDQLHLMGRHTSYRAIT